MDLESSEDAELCISPITHKPWLRSFVFNVLCVFWDHWTIYRLLDHTSQVLHLIQPCFETSFQNLPWKQTAVAAAETVITTIFHNHISLSHWNPFWHWWDVRKHFFRLQNIFCYLVDVMFWALFTCKQQNTWGRGMWWKYYGEVANKSCYLITYKCRRWNNAERRTLQHSNGQSAHSGQQ